MFFNEDHEYIRDLAREFAEKEIAPIANEIDQNDEVPQRIYDMMADMGFFGLKIPEEYGGSGLDTRSYVCVMEEICKKSITCSLVMSSCNSLSPAPMLLVGTEEQKQKYIPGIASGKEFMAFGLTEPGAGSDAGSLTTRAVEDGDSYILNGRKTFITGAPFAKNTVIFEKTIPEKGVKGITCFIVDLSLPGVIAGQARGQDGAARAWRTSDIVLETCGCRRARFWARWTGASSRRLKTLSIGGSESPCQGSGVAGRDGRSGEVHQGAQAVREIPVPVPGSAVHDRGHGGEAERGAALNIQRGVRDGHGARRDEGGVDGEVLFDGDGAGDREQGAADARRLRLHQGIPH